MAIVIGRKKIIEGLKDGSLSFMTLSENLRNDPEIVKIAVSHNGLLLKHIPDGLKQDLEIIKTAISQNRSVAEHIIASAIGNEKIVSMILNQYESDPENIPEKLRNNRAFMERAIAQNGLLLKYAPEELRSDPEIAKIAILQNKRALQFVPEDLLINSFDIDTIVIDIYKCDPWDRSHFYQFPEDARGDKGFVMMTMLKHPATASDILRDSSNELRDDIDIAYIAVSGDKFALQYVSERLRKDPEFMEWAKFYCPFAEKYSLVEESENE